MVKTTPTKSAPKARSGGKSPGGKVSLLEKFKAKRAARKLAMGGGSEPKNDVDAGGSSGTTQRKMVVLWQHHAKRRRNGKLNIFAATSQNNERIKRGTFMSKHLAGILRMRCA